MMQNGKRSEAAIENHAATFRGARRSAWTTVLKTYVREVVLSFAFWSLSISAAIAQVSVNDRERPPVARATQDSPAANIEAATAGGVQFWTDWVYRQGWRVQEHALTGHFRLLDARNRRRAWGTLSDCQNELERLSRDEHISPDRGAVVILLHGLGRTRGSMESLGGYLRQQGDYRIVNLSYASTRKPLADHARALASVIDHLTEVDQFDVVAHSLGNLVLRYYLGDQYQAASPSPQLQKFHRIVMLAPPNQGAQLARTFEENGLFRLVLGEPGKQLSRDWQSISDHLATPRCEFGVLAGSRPWSNPLVDGRDDLIVSVSETRLVGARDFLVLPVLHTWMMQQQEVQTATLQFLKQGYFRTEAERHPIK